MSRETDYNMTNYVMPFVIENFSKLKTIPKFKDCTNANEVIDKMCITIKAMNKFNIFIKTINKKHAGSNVSAETLTIPKNTLLINSAYENPNDLLSDDDKQEQINNLKNTIKNKFLEFDYNGDNNIRKGTMSFTSCITANFT